MSSLSRKRKIVNKFTTETRKRFRKKWLNSPSLNIYFT